MYIIRGHGKSRATFPISIIIARLHDTYILFPAYTHYNYLSKCYYYYYVT